MVKKLRYMGEEIANPLMKRVDSYFMGLYRIMPFTYFGILRRPFHDFLNESRKVTVLDLACGDGSATQSLGLPKNFEITGVDIFSPYIELAKKKKIYKKVIKKDITKFSPKKKFDVVMVLHVLEHLDKKKGSEFLREIEKFADKKVIVATPIGFFPQSEYDANPYQVHKSFWLPKEMTKRGYRVRAQGLRILWGNDNVVSKYGVLSYLLFLISALSTPAMWLNPNFGTYMVCDKDIKRK